MLKGLLIYILKNLDALRRIADYSYKVSFELLIAGRSFNEKGGFCRKRLQSNMVKCKRKYTHFIKNKCRRRFLHGNITHEKQVKTK